MLVWRSTRITSSRAGSVNPSTSHPSNQNIVEALPGRKRKVGYAYQVLQPVAGHKRSAMSTALDDGHHGPTSRKLASAADFSPTHFDEPASDGLILLTGPSQLNPDQILPMRTELDAPVHTPASSPISQNLLLWREDPMDVQTPSPMRRHSVTLRTRDSNAAWAAAEGLVPIPEDFTTVGYTPVQVVGGITYMCRVSRTVPRPIGTHIHPTLSCTSNMTFAYAS
ncbi:hypothetical protein L208DRAFT_844956 [Tricholoma matsutake]|nr:hypothetical protein L208DRAFT_844956 [Tricholoma matsutake 945]